MTVTRRFLLGMSLAAGVLAAAPAFAADAPTEIRIDWVMAAERGGDWSHVSYVKNLVGLSSTSFAKSMGR